FHAWCYSFCVHSPGQRSDPGNPMSEKRAPICECGPCSMQRLQLACPRGYANFADHVGVNSRMRTGDLADALVGNEDIVRRVGGSPVVVHRELEHDQTTIERPLAVRPGNRESGSGYLRRDGDRAVAVVDDPGVLLATVSANRDHLAIRPGEGVEE